MVSEHLDFDVSVSGTLDKFEGEPVPENLFERLTIENGKVVRVQKFVNGKEVD